MQCEEYALFKHAQVFAGGTVYFAGWWVGAQCLSLTGCTVAQLWVSLALTVFELSAFFFVSSQ